jgi:beta-lactamase superfamily II metal-dependent hydrolase
VHDCIVRKAELTKLEVAICTHYDKDHMNGLTALLEFGSKVYDSTRIFDCGSITTDADNDVRNYNTAATSSSRVDRAAGCRLAFAHGSQHVRRRTSLRLKGG